MLHTSRLTFSVWSCSTDVTSASSRRWRRCWRPSTSRRGRSWPGRGRRRGRSCSSQRAKPPFSGTTVAVSPRWPRSRRARIVGELSVLRGAPRSATVTATLPLTGYAGDAAAFAALLDVPGVAERIAPHGAAATRCEHPPGRGRSPRRRPAADSTDSAERSRKARRHAAGVLPRVALQAFLQRPAAERQGRPVPGRRRLRRSLRMGRAGGRRSGGAGRRIGPVHPRARRARHRRGRVLGDRRLSGPGPRHAPARCIGRCGG